MCFGLLCCYTSSCTALLLGSVLSQNIVIHRVVHPVQVEVIDSVTDYLATLKEVFDFPTLKEFVGRKDFSFCFDAMNAVTGAYAAPIFVNELGADKSVVM